MKTKYLILISGIMIIFLLVSVSAISPRGNVTVQFSVNNWTNGNSNLKSNRWIDADGELYRTYGGSTDTWGLSNLKGSNFTNSKFQVGISSDNIQGWATIYVDHVQVRIYYTIPTTVTLVSPTPANNSIIGSTFRVNATVNVVPTDCWLQNNRNGSYVNETMTITGSNCSIFFKGLNNNTFFYSVIANGSGGIGASQTRNVSIRNLPSYIDLNSPVNNTLTSNKSVILNWTVNNTQNDEVIVRGFISQNTTANITRQIFYYGEGNLNRSYTYNFSSMLTPLNSSGLWALYRFDNNSDEGENSTHVKDFSQYSRNGTSTKANFRNGKFGKGFYHSSPNELQEITMQSKDFANISFNGMSINVWLNMTVNDSYRNIVSRFNTVDNDRFFRLQYENDRMFFDIHPNGNTTVCSVNMTNGLNTNRNYMITGTFNGSQINIYQDGILNRNITCSFNGINQTAWQDSRAVSVGEIPSDTSNFEGVIDELGFWNKSLSAQEVSDLYNLKNDTYFWYMESNEYNANNGRVNSSLFQFIIGEQVNFCAYTSGNWDINRANNCIINSDVVGDMGANMTVSGDGNFSLNGVNISGFNDYIFKKDCSGSNCEDFVLTSGIIG